MALTTNPDPFITQDNLSASPAISTFNTGADTSFIEQPLENTIPSVVQQRNNLLASSPAVAALLQAFLEEQAQQHGESSPFHGITSQSIINRLRQGSFVSPSRSAVTSAQSVPQFTNILEDPEESPVADSVQNVVPEGFIQVIPKEDESGFDEDGSPFGTSTSISEIGESISDMFSGPTAEEEAQAATMSPAFAPESSPTSSSANPTIGPPTEPISTMVTPADIARAEKEGRPTLEVLGMKASREMDLLANKAAVEFGNYGAKDALADFGKTIGRSVTEGLVVGANPALQGTLTGTIIGAALFGAGLTGAQMATSTYSNYGVGDFFSALLNNIIPFADFFGIGTSVSDMEDQQEIDDLLAEDAFSLYGKDPDFYGRNLVDDKQMNIKDITNLVHRAQNEYYGEGYTVAVSMANPDIAHSFGDPHDTGRDDTTEEMPEDPEPDDIAFGPSDSPSDTGSTDADQATDSDEGGDIW